ncbi:MAG: deoxyribonuclease IV, partial [Desulfohalobiaceae bacterium]
ETTAGQGTGLGASFAELRQILDQVESPDRYGVCFDTCHVFAAGYDLSTKAGYEATMEEFEHAVGLSRIGFFHLNDSKTPCGSRRDRHEHIGLGHIGLSGFGLLLSDPRFEKVPMVLETPKGEDLDLDRQNLQRLLSLLP